MQYINKDYQHLYNPDRLFDQIAAESGEVYRALENRRTVRIEKEGEFYFAKSHFGVGWWEIIKNLMQLRLPVLGAENEFRALQALKRLGVHSLTPVAFSSEGRNPAKRRSCIVTRALVDAPSLEELFQERAVSVRQKRSLIPKLAAIARTLHENGINHRDFYLCHFLLMSDDQIPYLIDLHRAQIRPRTPRRWQVKDIGGLFFSAFDFEVTRRDVYRFMAAYSGKSLRLTLDEDASFWRSVYQRAARLYRQDHDTLPLWVQALETHQ